MILLVVLPVFAVIIGLGIYLSGGRYISTDNAYVGAQKVLITPDISGKITHVAVREGQHVNPGDELFTLDREPFALALQQAKAKLDTARSDFDKLDRLFARCDEDDNRLLGHDHVEQGAYINDFKLLMILTLATIPLVLIIGRARQAPGAKGKAVAIE